MPDFRPMGQSLYYARVTNSRPSFDDIRFINPPRDRSVALNDDNTIRGGRLFTYMDVGSWINRIKTFGVVYGDSNWGYVALCNYEPTKSAARIATRCQHAGVPGNPLGQTLTRFLQHSKGYIAGPAGGRALDLKLNWRRGLDTEGKIYVFIGDLHLPVATRSYSQLPYGRIRGEDIFRALWQSWEARFRDGILSGVGRGSHYAVNDANWLERYYQADIFGNAATSLNQFIGLLESWDAASRNPPLHFVQVGDLYEMWIGLNRLFERSDRHQVNLTIPDDADIATFDTTTRDISTVSDQYKRVLARETIIDWMRRTDRATVVSSGAGSVSLTSRIFGANVTSKTFIVGNHDCYTRALTSRTGPLSSYPRPKIIKDPSQAIDAPINNELSLPQTYVNRFLNSMHIEHGHEVDIHNRFGAVSGWEITQFAYVVPGGRRIQGMYYDFAEESDLLEAEREVHIKYSLKKALEHRNQDRQMRVFVMAHTHAPFLSTINFIVG